MGVDAEAAHEALQALGLAPGARLLGVDDVVLSLIPREDGLAPKDVPVDTLLAKLTSMRDKLRVLEQRVNATDISAVEKAALQSRITAVYAAFNAFASFFSNEALPLVVETFAPAAPAPGAPAPAPAAPAATTPMTSSTTVRRS